MLQRYWHWRLHTQNHPNKPPFFTNLVSLFISSFVSFTITTFNAQNIMPQVGKRQIIITCQLGKIVSIYLICASIFRLYLGPNNCILFSVPLFFVIADFCFLVNSFHFYCCVIYAHSFMTEKKQVPFKIGSFNVVEWFGTFSFWIHNNIMKEMIAMALTQHSKIIGYVNLFIWIYFVHFPLSKVSV